MSLVYIYMCQIVTAQVEQIMLIGHDVNKNIGHKWDYADGQYLGSIRPEVSFKYALMLG
jgi:hypothetical protein